MASLVKAVAASTLAVAMGACASSGPRTPDQNPAIVAAVQAVPRVVAGETTWVSRGPGYEIVAFTTRDIAAVDSSVARQSRAYRDVFGAEPPPVVVLVHRVTLGGGDPGYQPEPPLPAGDLTPVVEVPIVTRAGNDKSPGQVSGGSVYGDGLAGALDAPPVERVARAWLSARASAITGHSTVEGSSGLVDDPRVPGWAEALGPALAARDSAVGGLAVALSGPGVRVMPLAEFFTTARPQQPFMAGRGGDGPGQGAGEARGGGERGGEGPGGRGGEGGEGGGFGGRGGFGGMGGGYGRGGMGGGMGGGGAGGGMRGGRGGRGGGSRGGAQAVVVLRGAALFEAEATVLGHYLVVRQGAPLVGQLVDANIRGLAVDSVLAQQPRGPKSVAQLDADWRQWLAARAESEQKH